jgi:hypothetical protein
VSGGEMKPNKTDWRILLKRYMAHVVSSEGTSFINNGYRTCDLTDDEKELLNVIEQEVEDEQ